MIFKLMRHIAMFLCLIVSCFSPLFSANPVSNVAVPQGERIVVQSVGYVSLDLPFPERQSLTIALRPENGSPIQAKLSAHNGRIRWISPPLPVGTYLVSYFLPEGFDTPLPEQIIVNDRMTVHLTPGFVRTASIHVSANIPGALYLLRTTKDSKAWKGEGRDFVFKGLAPGSYLLSFSAEDLDNFLPPKERRLFLSEFEKKEVQAAYQIAGRLHLQTNVGHSIMTIQPLAAGQKPRQESLDKDSTTLVLPEGRYRISLEAAPALSKSTDKKYTPPIPAEVKIESLKIAELQMPFQTTSNAPAEKLRTLKVTANVTNAGFTLLKFEDSIQMPIGHFVGKAVQTTLPSSEEYMLVFDDLPNFQTPAPITLNIEPGEEKVFSAIYLFAHEMVKIPAGRAIIGDARSEEEINTRSAKVVAVSPFSMAVYEVTNGQYADWLIEAIKAGRCRYVQAGATRGQVLDLHGRLLFKTFQADPYSQVSAHLQSVGPPLFSPLPGKDAYPVINVTWYGAAAYCQDNQCRLPTEAEWEKAGGMLQEPAGAPLKKFRFGFGRNEIDATWANYKVNDQPILYFQVHTTPVGFYNGSNFLPLTGQNRVQQQTHLAKSSYGLFDVSGNVWEWVADWFEEEYASSMAYQDPQGPSTGTQKVAKGGCYDSLAAGVRVSERIALAPDHADAFTGFRVASNEE
jgi:formylglycine-generating enzyme required for sulfatase activity